MIINHKGDLVEFGKNYTGEKELIIAHGCNLVGGFGAGIARQIAKTWPIAKRIYDCNYAHCTLGEYVLLKVENDVNVAHCFTQEKIRSHQYDRVAIPSAITLALYELIRQTSYLKGYELHTVKIGSGLGGLSVEEVDEIFETLVEFTGCNIHVWDF